MTEKPDRGLKVPFGRKGDRFVAPTDALATGLDCQCTCPGCGARLQLRQGSKRRHFAHHNASGSDRCVESAIHAAAKQVLIDHGGLVVPEFSFGISASTEAGQLLYEEDILSPMRFIRFDRVVPEVSLNDVRPDIVGYRGERQLLVEMYFRHRVDPEKRAKLRGLGIAAVEIDLSDLDPISGFDAVKDRVIDNPLYKEWLVYPRSQEHLNYLKDKLRARIDAANDIYREQLERRRLEREELAARVRAERVAATDFDTAFSTWGAGDQDAWLRQQLNLKSEMPAFLARPSFPESVVKVSAFLFQGSIFARFIHGGRLGSRLNAHTIYPCLRRRFSLPPREASTHRLVINMYLEYLTRARFLSRPRGRDLVGPYFIEHNEMSMPHPTSIDTQYDGEPLLSQQARGSGPRRRWSSRRPRWRTVIEEANDVLEGSAHKDLILAALEELSAMHFPASPHHWAAPLVERGVPLEDCFDVLNVIGLI